MNLSKKLLQFLAGSFKKEPIAWAGIIFTIVLSLIPLSKSIYYWIVGPSYAILAEFKFPPKAQSFNNTLSVQIENYSDIPITGLKVFVSTNSDTIPSTSGREFILFGTVAPNDMSEVHSIELFLRQPGSGFVLFQCSPINDESNVRFKEVKYPFEVGSLD